MIREISAGGVVLRRSGELWEIAVIEPQREPLPLAMAKKGQRQSQKVLLALPKGLVDPGEKSEAAAVREVREETGLTASPITKLRDIKYVYVRSWGDQQRVFKIVSFFLLQYQSGRIDEIDPAMRVEVKQALWIPLEGSERKLAYAGEKEVVRLAQEYVKSQL
jgi:8-oxo-dGTP pyrophosphatase MutT (NUDIX family)